MDKDFYLSEIRDAYMGEIIGGAAFSALAKNEGIALPERERAALLAKLENVTRERMEPLIRHYGLDVGDTSAVESEVSASMAEPIEWSDFLGQMTEQLSSYIERFENLLAAAKRDEDMRILGRLLEHEIALRDFVELETQGRSGEATAVIERALA